MKVVVAPKEIHCPETFHWPKVFLAGGITNCPDWQKQFITELKRYNPKCVLYNPRRKKFPMDKPEAAKEQITWEYKHLQEADIIPFWFSKGSDNPIVFSIAIVGKS